MQPAKADASANSAVTLPAAPSLNSHRRGGGLRRGQHPADERLGEKIRRRLSSLARNTQLALGADWRVWYGFIRAELEAGHERSLWPIRAADLCAFVYSVSPPLLERADGTVQVDSTVTGPHIRRAGTVRRYLASLRCLTRLAGERTHAFKHPDVRHALRTISRGRGATRPKTGPVRMMHVRRLLLGGPRDLREFRDRAVVALGYCALLRPAETAQIQVEDLAPDGSGGAILQLRMSKADPQGLGQLCAVASQVYQLIRLWLRASEISSGPLFRAINRHGTLGTSPLSRGSVSLIFKRMAPLMRLDPARVSGHSGRIGAVHDMQDARQATSAIALAGRWGTEYMVQLYGRGRAAREGAMAQLWRLQTRSPASAQPPRKARAMQAARREGTGGGGPHARWRKALPR